jgi:signal transduction histidine kinase
MFLLPPLVEPPHRRELPAADGSAVLVLDSLAGARPAADLLLEALSADPPFLLWTVLVADRQRGFQPRRVADAAAWLAGHGQFLRWPETPDETPTAPPDPQAFADLVGARLLIADLAAQLATDAGSEAAEHAFLLGLLHAPQQWLAVSGDWPPNGSGGISIAIPHWMSPPAPTEPAEPSVRAVALAARIAAGEAALDDTAEIDLDGCRRRAADGRRRWLDPAPALAARLPSLLPKLARLAELEGRFDETLEREKLEAMAEFAAGAGHEINNPLTVIAGRAQLFLRDESDPERRRALALMIAQAMRVHEMIADMRLFARPPQPEREPLDVVELVDQLLEQFAAAAARQEIVLRRTGAGGPLVIDADRTQLTVALRAIVQNAVEAIGRKGNIEIEVAPDEHWLRLRVIDDGPGVTARQRRHIFDPYYSARQAGRGLGLGLSKAWRIVTNHGGRIDVESQPGHGAVFTVVLPRRV